MKLIDMLISLTVVVIITLGAFSLCLSLPVYLVFRFIFELPIPFFTLLITIFLLLTLQYGVILIKKTINYAGKTNET